MNTLSNIPQLAFFFAAALLTCSHADATTVTYNFDETGWINTAGTTENFSGSFTGTLETSGVLALSDLTAFTATVTETNAQNDTKPIATFGLATGNSALSNFLLNPTTNALTLAGAGTPGATVCLGATVAEGICGPVGPRPVSMQGVPAPPLEGLFVSSVNGTLTAATTAFPSITLVQTSINPGVVQAPAPASTPEPASSVLCGSALVLVSLVLRSCRTQR